MGRSGDSQTDASLTVAPQAGASRDYTDRQYAFNSEYGIGVPGWNTYDASGKPTPSVSATGKVVAVLDTGVDYNHEDLRNVMWSDGGNYPSLVALGGGAHGINVAMPRADKTPYDTKDPMDDGEHGTHVAGIIAGEWNKIGISGAASGAKILAVKTMNDLGSMSVSEALRGYRYVIAAQKAGVDVAAINNSWGDDYYSKSLDMAVREAGRLGAVSVFAAGNDRRDIDMISQMTNAFFNNPYVVVVGNSDRNGQMDESSSYGKRAVDVFAPGQAIYSTYPIGEGPADETADPLVAGGITYACDYESTTVQDNADNSVFAFKGGEGVALAIANEGRASAHSLSLTAKAGEMLTVTMSSKALAVGSECHGLCLWVKAPAAKPMSCMLVYNTTDGVTEEQHVMLRGASDAWQVVSFPIGRKAKKDALELTLTISVEGVSGSADGTILVDDVKMTSATIPYEYSTGTSMAAPAVAGGAAVLASAFPDDDAAKRAARIVGSVKPVANLADKCVSGGIFRLDEALAGNTGPALNGASTEAGAVTIEGFFFGNNPGSLAVDGQALTIVSWSDTAIVAKLPSGFSPGDKLVQVTTSAGKSGHQYFRIGTPASLYQRLPLPGRTLSSDPGDYGIASSAFDASFYAASPRALVGLGGSLYYLMETENATAVIYRYDIDGQTWEQIYEGGYAPGGGACTLNGKILFVAGQPKESKTYFGLFDPTTRTVEYTLYDSECFERECTLVNTGKGILLAGGRKFVYGLNREPSIEIVRTVDPESLAVSPVKLPDDVSLPDSWYSGVYDEEGNGYFFCGTRMQGFYKFSFADGGVTCTVLEAGPLAGKADDNAQKALSVQAGESVANSQVHTMVAGPTKSGIVASGPVTTNDAGVVTADTYTANWGETKFKATDKQMSVTKIFNPQGTAYRGRFYVIGASESEVGDWMFASLPVETIAQPGDVSPAPTPTPSPSPTPSKLPASGDPLFAVVFLLIAAGVVSLIAMRRARSHPKA